jgi:hypothetical protein
MLPQQQMLPPDPFHLSTRGRWGGAYGIATRGYLVLPDVVPRFPADGFVETEELVGLFTEEALEATLESIDWGAVLQPGLDVDGLIEDIVWRAMLEAQDMEGRLDGDKPFGGEVEEETDPWAEVEMEDGPIAEVEEADECAEVEDCSETAILVEKPGEGRCRRD